MYRIFVVVGILCLVMTSFGCAGVGGGQVKDYSQYERHFVDDYVEVMGRGFFNPDRFWEHERPQHEIVMKLSGDDKRFMNVRRMMVMLTKEIENERSCFWSIMLYLDTQVKAWVEPGAFILKVAHGDSIVEYRDRGLCTEIRLDAVNDRDTAYLDSAHRAYLFYDGIQPGVSGNPPVRAWGRYPPEASQGKVVGMRIDYDHWRYEGPGVKPKPQWK